MQKNQTTPAKNQAQNTDAVPMMESSAQLEETIAELSEQVVSLTQQLADAKRKEQLALADYQNLIRRTQEDRGKVARLAARSFVESLLQPLSHLALANEHLKDAGLSMIISQLWTALEQNGLQKVDALGKAFDVTTMEAVESGKQGKKVVNVIQEGYILNGEVIQHAKVILD